MPAKTRTVEPKNPRPAGTAKDRQVTSRLVKGDRVLAAKQGEALVPAPRVTGSLVVTVQTIKQASGGRRATYHVETDKGVSISLSGNQTWLMAPETADEAVERIQKEHLAAENAENAGKAPEAPGTDKATPVIDLAAEAAKRRDDFKAKNIRKAQAAKVAAEPAAQEPAKKAPAAKKAQPAKKAPAKKAAPKAERAEVKLPTGYAVKYDNGAYLLAKKGEGAAEAGSAWLVVCSAHGTTTEASKAKEGDEKGRKSGRVNWCKGCKTA